METGAMTLLNGHPAATFMQTLVCIQIGSLFVQVCLCECVGRLCACRPRTYFSLSWMASICFGWALSLWIHVRASIGLYVVHQRDAWGRWDFTGMALHWHAHTRAYTRHKVSTCKLVSLLRSDRVDKPFMRGINKAALPPSHLSPHPFNLKLQISF